MQSGDRQETILYAEWGQGGNYLCKGGYHWKVCGKSWGKLYLNSSESKYSAV